MPKIVKEHYYNGAKERIARLGLAPILEDHVSIASLNGVRDLLRQLGTSVRRRVAIYKDGRIYKYHHATMLQRWFESLSSPLNGDSPRFPPIAASILVAQKIRHTWLPKKSLNGSL